MLCYTVSQSDTSYLNVVESKATEAESDREAEANGVGRLWCRKLLRQPSPPLHQSLR